MVRYSLLCLLASCTAGPVFSQRPDPGFRELGDSAGKAVELCRLVSVEGEYDSGYGIYELVIGGPGERYKIDCFRSSLHMEVDRGIVVADLHDFGLDGRVDNARMTEDGFTLALDYHASKGLVIGEEVQSFYDESLDLLVKRLRRN